METFSEQLYEDLMKICSPKGDFYFKDISLDGLNYRIFNYRLCSYEQFHLHVNALNARGTMFDTTDPTKIRLVSLPPEKFFNYEEGDGLKKHSLARLTIQMEKLDGSLISTYLHSNGQVNLKSKASLQSTQARQANQLLVGPLRKEIEKLVHLGYTVNMEYTSPFNQIVVRYPRSRLTVLSLRSHRTGQSFYADRLLPLLEENQCSTMIEHLVSYRLISTEQTQSEFISQIRQETEGEGYVIELLPEDQQRQAYLVKVKNHKYLLLHQTRTDLDNPKRLFQCIINEQTDDLRSLIVDDQESLKRLTWMEEQIRPKFNQMVQSVEQFYQDHRHLTRKDFAVTISKNEQMKVFLALLMNLYSGKESDYKAFALQHANDIFHLDQLQSLATSQNVDQEE